MRTININTTACTPTPSKVGPCESANDKPRGLAMKRFVSLNRKGDATIKNIKPDINEISHFEVEDTASEVCAEFILFYV